MTKHLDHIDEPQGDSAHASFYVALTGNPNCGKTTVFNALTGLQAKVGNYSGVTVERKEGRMKVPSGAAPVTILDLPGTYSLSPKSMDEEVSRDILFKRLPDVPPPAVVVVVLDAANLLRHLYYTTQVIELGYPVIVALNMIDVAREHGHVIDPKKLSEDLGAPVIPLVARKNQGISELKQAILDSLPRQTTNAAAWQERPIFCELSPAFAAEVTPLVNELNRVRPDAKVSVLAEALLLLSDERTLSANTQSYPRELVSAVLEARKRLEAVGVDWRSDAISARYTRIGIIYRRAVTVSPTPEMTFSDKLDRILMHRVWGLVIFFAIMGLMFQGIFRFARLPMDLIASLAGKLGAFVEGAIPPGALNDLLVNGVVAGVGAVVVFLPQIALLFLFISVLEDTGYMARAAFIMDRVMMKVGLHGKSFIPMLSSFACAIPGIMASRVIESPRDRLVTILVTPMLSCSARLPVYAVLIAACIPDNPLLGGLFRLPGLVLMAVFLLGIFMALIMAWVFKKTLLKGKPLLLLMELPPYKAPGINSVFRHVWDRSKVFLQQAGTVILGINILLWFLTHYPQGQIKAEYQQKREAIVASAPVHPGQTNAVNPTLTAQLAALDDQESGARLSHSFAGRLGHFIEPALSPLGLDWKIGIGIAASFAAREVFISTMAIVYNAGSLGTGDNATSNLAHVFKIQKRPDGSPLYTPLLGITLMVFYVFALQCASTVVVVKRETNSWKWPLFQWTYLGALAWGLAFLVAQVGRLMGWG